jgi:hypothetical protein
VRRRRKSRNCYGLIMSRTGGCGVALAAVVAGLLAVVWGGCATETVCCDSCPADESAIFQLSCTSADLTGVATTGPCARDAGLSLTRSDDAAWVGTVFVQGQSPGVCHVELTFATGFTYSAAVTFAAEPGGVCGGPQCKCGDYLAATSGPFTVNNPSDTCVALPDAAEDGAPDADADGPP